MTTSTADLMKRIQKLRTDLRYPYTADASIEAHALQEGLRMYLAELEAEKRREDGWVEAMTKEQAS